MKVFKRSFLTSLLIGCLLLAGCAQPADGDGTDMQWNPKVGGDVNLAVLPENCELIPFAKFKEGFAFISGTDWTAPPATLEQVEEAFGTKGLYYEDGDVNDGDVLYKTFGWFSDEDWLDSKIAVAVSFRVNEETGELTYYSYTAQGITYEDVQ